MIYLYLKQHNTTGLYYFGRTYRNPYKYNGSGTYWKRHIKRHGNNISTVVVWSFNSLERCSEFAIEFSNKHDIVNNSSFANLVIETALEGSPKGRKLSLATKLKISKNHTNVSGCNNPMYGKSHSIKTKKQMKESHRDTSGTNNPMFGRTHTESVKQLISDHGKLKWDNGARDKLKQTLSYGIYHTPWGDFKSVTDAVKHPSSVFKDYGTLRNICTIKLNQLIRSGPLKGNIPLTLGYGFTPYIS